MSKPIGKPIVKTEKVMFDSRDHAALVKPMDHPRQELNEEIVTTSDVHKVIMETLNTVYVWVRPKDERLYDNTDQS